MSQFFDIIRGPRPPIFCAPDYASTPSGHAVVQLLLSLQSRLGADAVSRQFQPILLSMVINALKRQWPVVSWNAWQQVSFTPVQDFILLQCVEKYGAGNWNIVFAALPLHVQSAILNSVRFVVIFALFYQ
jgi:hypothetical protein